MSLSIYTYLWILDSPSKILTIALLSHSSMALLRHRRPASIIPLSKRNCFLTRGGVLRLVVQREVCVVSSTVPTERTTVPAAEEVFKTHKTQAA